MSTTLQPNTQFQYTTSTPGQYLTIYCPGVTDFVVVRWVGTAGVSGFLSITTNSSAGSIVGPFPPLTNITVSAVSGAPSYDVSGAGAGGGASLASANNWALSQTSTEMAVSYGTGTVTLDGLTHSNHINIGVLTGALTLANPTGFTNAVTLNVWITQDATGSRALTLGTAIKTAGGAGLTLSTAPNAVDVVSLIYNPAKAIWFAAIAKAVA